MRAGQPQPATELVGLASQADGQQEAEVLAARSVLARLWPPGAGAPVTGPDSAALAQAAWKAERCPAAAVEMFYVERPGTGQPRSTLDTARALIDELPAAADLHGALEILVLPVPDEILLAAAERAAREQNFEVARRLADQARASVAPQLATEAAELRARIAGEARRGRRGPRRPARRRRAGQRDRRPHPACHRGVRAGAGSGERPSGRRPWPSRRPAGGRLGQAAWRRGRPVRPGGRAAGCRAMPGTRWNRARRGAS